MTMNVADIIAALKAERAERAVRRNEAASVAVLDRVIYLLSHLSPPTPKTFAQVVREFVQGTDREWSARDVKDECARRGEPYGHPKAAYEALQFLEGQGLMVKISRGRWVWWDAATPPTSTAEPKDANDG